MHTITVTFEDKEFEDLLKEKGKTTWHNFILLPKIKIEKGQSKDKLIAFIKWLIRDYNEGKENPYYIDEYVHDKIDEWYKRG